MEFVGVLDQTYTFNNSVCEGRFTVYLSNPPRNVSTVVSRVSILIYREDTPYTARLVDRREGQIH